MEEKRTLQSIPDDELLRRLAELLGQSRRIEADIVAEVDDRRLYAREAFPSMFAYCMAVLHLSEAEAYLRISAARASRKHPVLLTMLADGRLHLTAIAKLARHLTCQNRDGLLERATHRSRRQIEKLIAEIAPRPDVPSFMRRLPDSGRRPTARLGVPNRGEGPILGLRPEPILGLGPDLALELRPDGVAAPEPGALRDADNHSNRPLHREVPAVARNAAAVPASPSESAPSAFPVAASPVSPTIVQPLSPGRYKVQFMASTEFHDKLEKLRALMGSRVPNADLGTIIEQAVTEKLERLEVRRFAQTRARSNSSIREKPGDAPKTEEARRSPSSRHIPAAVRRAVRQRDGDRCRYTDTQGRRCEERHRLEFHHRHPFGLGGDHSVANVGLMCRAHNAYMAEYDYGREAMARHRPPRSGAPESGVDWPSGAHAQRTVGAGTSRHTVLAASPYVGSP
jgi:5-methylcytosine-specific restriction endonuclease McrA